jgi:hypothetical protein
MGFFIAVARYSFFGILLSIVSVFGRASGVMDFNRLAPRSLHAPRTTDDG